MPTRIHASALLNLQSYKTSTSVLENEQGEFVEFGFDAEEQYSQLIQSQEGGKLALYRHFKMMLHKCGVRRVHPLMFSLLFTSALWFRLFQDLSRRSTVCATNGKVRPALDVFAYSLRFMKEHLFEALAKSTTTYACVMA